MLTMSFDISIFYFISFYFILFIYLFYFILFFIFIFFWGEGVKILRWGISVSEWCWCTHIWGSVCQKHVSSAGTSNHIPYYMWYAITCPCHFRAYIPLIMHTVLSLSSFKYCVYRPIDDVIKWKHFPRSGFLCGECHRWTPLTKASDAELWCFLWSVPEPTVKQTIKTPVIWDAVALIMTSM